jgi:deoxycytidylate deaminase
MKNIPNTGLLTEVAPLAIWEEASKQARRSTHMRHRTGAVIFKNGKRPEVFAKGCSHNHDGGMAIASVHAEHDAITNLPRDFDADTICIVTLTRAGNFAKNSRPCLSCARQLTGIVRNVIYCEVDNDGSWLVNSETIESLLQRSNGQWSQYARRMNL